jgi:hypothetical protein
MIIEPPLSAAHIAGRRAYVKLGVIAMECIGKSR